MDDAQRQTAFMSALTTEHFVLQTAASSTISEAAARTSLYVFSLSSSLVAMGFTWQSPETFRLFAAAVLPALFVLGLAPAWRCSRHECARPSIQCSRCGSAPPSPSP